jgi:hypothetical protein
MVTESMRREAEAHLKEKTGFPAELSKIRTALESGNGEYLGLLLTGIRRRREQAARVGREQANREAKKRRTVERMRSRVQNAAEMNQAIEANLAELEKDPEWRRIMGRK